MEITVQKNAFLKALNHGQSIVEKRTTVPILSHVLLSATKSSGLTLTSTDLDLSLIETIPAQVHAEGRICVSAHLLYDITRKLPDLPISLTINPTTQTLNIKAGRSDFNLPGLGADDFPDITNTPLTHHFEINTKDLSYMIDNAQFAMADDGVRHHLNGIYFHLIENGRKLRAVASDLHRMACVAVETPVGLTDMPYTIVGRKAILEIRKLLDQNLETVSIGLSERRFELNLHGTNHSICFSTRLVDGLFPEYQHALSAHVSRGVKVNTRALAEAADRVSTVITGFDRILRINLSGQQASLSAVSQQLGAAQEEIDVESTSNEPMQICFNASYLLDIAGLIKDETMCLDITSEDTPTIIRPANDNNNYEQIYAIMHLTA